jgi:two-component sensor histidine kinase
VQGELLAQADPAMRYRAVGPILYRPEAAHPLALALHELAHEALLHGVIGEPVGHIEVRWDHEDADGGKRLRISGRNAATQAQASSDEQGLRTGVDRKDIAV